MTVQVLHRIPLLANYSNSDCDQSCRAGQHVQSVPSQSALVSANDMFVASIISRMLSEHALRRLSVCIDGRGREQGPGLHER